MIRILHIGEHDTLYYVEVAIAWHLFFMNVLMFLVGVTFYLLMRDLNRRF